MSLYNAYHQHKRDYTFISHLEIKIFTLSLFVLAPSCHNCSTFQTVTIIRVGTAVASKQQPHLLFQFIFFIKHSSIMSCKRIFQFFFHLIIIRFFFVCLSFVVFELLSHSMLYSFLVNENYSLFLKLCSYVNCSNVRFYVLNYICTQY